jgi:hypothetical protein
LIIEYHHHRAKQQQTTTSKMSVMSNGNIDLSVAEAAYGKHCDLYRDVLQVHPKASAQKIQDAYFTRRKHLFQVLSHLEQSTEPRTKQSELKRRRAERKMDAVVSAVRILGDAELRVQYNEVRKRRPPQPPLSMNNNHHSSRDTTNKKRRAKQQSSSLSKPHHHQKKSSVAELPSLHDTSNSSTNITDEYSTSHEISDDEEEEANGRGGRDKVTANHTAPTTPTAAPAAPLKSALLLSTRSKTRVAFAGPNNNQNKDQIPPPQQPSSKRRPVAAAAGRKPPSSTRAASTAKSAVVADETESTGSASLLMLSDTEDDEEEDGEEGTTLCSATVYDDLDDDVVSRGDRLLPDVPRPPEGLLDRVRMEFLGALDDTARSFEQVFNAFTLQEEDIDAVVRRIDKAKLQIIQGHTTSTSTSTTIAPPAAAGTAGNSSSSHNNDKPRVRRR